MSSESSEKLIGTFYGIGVGPGDPELITLKAHKLIQTCDVLVYLQSDRGNSMARTIAAESIAASAHPDQQEVIINMPMSNSRDVANDAYDQGAKDISHALDAGKDVAFLCQGDPMFFGSFCYLLDRLGDQYPVEIIPGVSSINAGAAQLGQPLGLLAENIAILSGRRSDEDIAKTLGEFDNIVIIKPGRRRQRIVELLKKTGRAGDAGYIEYAGQSEQKMVFDITEIEQGNGPYFSLFLISRDRPYFNHSHN